MLIYESTYMINKGINVAETLIQCEKSDFIMRIDKAEVKQNTLEDKIVAQIFNVRNRALKVVR